MQLQLKLFLLALCGGTGIACAQPRPQWMHRLPRARNATYVFVPVTVEARSLETGRPQSLKMLALDRGLLSSLEMRYRGTSETDSRSTETNGRFGERIETHTVDVTEFDGRPVQVTARIVDEFLRRGELTTLYQVGVTPAPVFDPVTVTTRYGARGLWRSAIVPGWGQFHKGSNLKGGLILGGCAMLAGGIVFTENQRSDYARKIARTHDKGLIDSYATKRDHFSTARNIAIGAAAALYLYNLIDAVAAPGARRTVVRPRRNNPVTYSFAPSLSADGSAGLMASVTF